MARYMNLDSPLQKEMFMLNPAFMPNSISGMQTAFNSGDTPSKTAFKDLLLDVGIYTSTTALEAAYPAASHIGRLASVGASAPYTIYVSDGSAWVVQLTSTQVSDLAGQLPRSIASRKKFKQVGREYFYRIRASLGYGVSYIPNTATVVYIDVNSATNGVGSLTDPMNAIPATATNGTTYLFAEQTVISVSPSIAGTRIGASTLWGTYERSTGKRLFIESNRLATFSFSAASGVSARGFDMNLNNIGVVFSGLKFTSPDVIFGDRRGINVGSSATNVSPFIEYCIFENIDSRLPAGGTPTGAAITSFSNNTTVRFCTFRNVLADNIWCGAISSAGGENFSCYGNDIIVPNTQGLDGPDGIQHSTDHPIKSLYITGNYVELYSNIKQCIISSGSGYATTDTAYMGKNVCIGSDLSSPKASNNNKVIEFQGYNLYFETNLLWGGQYGLNTSHKATILGNVFVCGHDNTTIVDTSLTSTTLYFGISVGGNDGVADSSKIFNNTFVRNVGTGGTAIHQTNSTTAHEIKNNCVVGPFQIGIRFSSTGATEGFNAVYGSVIAWANAGGTSVGTGTNGITTDPKLDYTFSPGSGSSLIVSSNNASYIFKSFIDYRGYLSSYDAPIVGAVTETSYMI